MSRQKALLIFLLTMLILTTVLSLHGRGRAFDFVWVGPLWAFWAVVGTTMAVRSRGWARGVRLLPRGFAQWILREQHLER
jgi:hypothetical protein